MVKCEALGLELSQNLATRTKSNSNIHLALDKQQATGQLVQTTGGVHGVYLLHVKPSRG